MYTKNIIQQNIEQLESNNHFFEQLEQLMDEYMIDNAIFVPAGDTYYEAVDGYFQIHQEYNSLDDLKQNYDAHIAPHIRIIENNIYQCGRTYQSLSNIHESENMIYDIRAQKIVK